MLEKIIGFLTVVGIVGGVFIYLHFQDAGFGQFDSGTELEMTQQEALAAMSDADVLLFRGETDRINKRPEVYADGQLAGRFVESGIIHTKYALESAETEIFDWQYWYEDVGDGITATCFICRDENEKVLGYAEETVMDFADGSSEYEYLFYDGDKNLKDYYLDDLTTAIYSMDGQLLDETDWSADSKNYDIHVLANDGGQVDLADKIFLFTRQMGVVGNDDR